MRRCPHAAGERVEDSTGVLIHQLAEEESCGCRTGRRERLLPGLLPYGALITVAQLLTHTSGLIDKNDVAKNPDAYR